VSGPAGERAPAGRWPALEEELRSYVETLCSFGPDRFPGSRGHRRAFRWLRRTLRSWGLPLEVRSFTVRMEVPVRWKLEADLGRGWEDIPCIPGLGSPPVRDIAAPVVPVGYAREEDYADLAGLEGSFHLARLWKSHEQVKVREASRRGAAALVWYNEYFDSLYSGACDSHRAAPIPGVAVTRRDAERILGAERARMRLSIAVDSRSIRCSNLVAGALSGPAALLASHHDTRPFTPGASDDASGMAVMLAFIRAGFGKDLPMPMRYLFADCEEEGCAGAETYAEDLYHGNRLREVLCAVNLDAVGWPNLCVVTRDREALLDEGMARLAERCFRALGFSSPLVRSRTGRSNHTPFARRGVPALWLSDHPNYIRHSDIDNIHNIDYPTMALAVNALRDIFSGLGHDIGSGPGQGPGRGPGGGPAADAAVGGPQGSAA
jgi:aminopeptidase YwaD